MIVTDIKRVMKSGDIKLGFYMQRYLKQNLDPIPAFLAKKWDVVGVVTGRGLVGCGKTVSKDTCVKIVEDGKIINSKPLGEYKNGGNLNTLSTNPNTGKIVQTIAEVIQEVEDKDFYIIELEDGRKVECSMDHKFYIKRNNKIIVLPLKEIKEGEEIICSTENFKV
jgi:intein/homing endonuclease